MKARPLLNETRFHIKKTRRENIFLNRETIPLIKMQRGGHLLPVVIGTSKTVRLMSMLGFMTLQLYSYVGSEMKKRKHAFC